MRRLPAVTDRETTARGQWSRDDRPRSM